MSDERPSIAELQRLRAATHYVDPKLLHAELPHDLRDAGYKDEVVTEINAIVKAAPVLVEIVAAALAWQGAVRERCDYGTATYANNPFDITSPQFRTETASLDAISDGLLNKFLAALSKVRQ